MAQDSTPKYPLPSFHFDVSIGGATMSFSEVSGLNQEVQSIDYRHGDSPVYSSLKLSGLHKFSNVTLKRGMAKGDSDFIKWINTANLNAVERKDVIINLLNEDHAAVVTWTLRNCFPVKVEGATMKASGNEVAVETVELTHEGLSVDYK